MVLPADATLFERLRKRVARVLYWTASKIDPGPFHSVRCGTDYRGCAPECEFNRRQNAEDN